MVAGATLTMAMLCAMSSHPVDALVDAVGASKSGVDGTTTREGLDRRD
jgi:hypothetical protein